MPAHDNDRIPETPEKRTGLRIRPAYLVIGLLSILAEALMVHFNAFDYLYVVSRAYEAWEIDEAFMLFVVAAVALSVVLLVHARELRREIAEREKAEQIANILARRDTLTGLANRRLFQDEMERRFDLARSQRGSLAVLLLDLDRFKAVNDKYGQRTGDRLLQTMADRLARAVDREAFLARLGGDEFAVLTDPGPDNTDLIRIARRLQAAVAHPYHRAGIRWQLTVSIGIATYPGDNETAEGLLHAAENALARAKAQGRNAYALVDPGLDRMMSERLELEAALREGLQHGQIIAHYQPIVDLASGRTIGVEALARWNHPKQGLLPPAAFIQLAEDVGLIGDVFLAVLHQACHDGLVWDPSIVVAVNVSPSQFRDRHLADEILKALDETSFPPGRLEIEITESVLLDDVDLARDTIRSLRDAGIHLSLDDFGTGYSSFQQLRDLPLDKLKIDRSFIMKLGSDDQSRKVVELIIGLAHVLGMRALAEGIECPADAAWLAARGCDLGQGYHFARPLPALDVTRRLLAERPRAQAGA
ncbi:putative bifunctional diguanylate cyclase/phosphodiesterase [Zavarzinia sp.]|uniref:putative bifunctional diguanylate cyclase/phosphodiesterase n=1 Tax=Zavarzinia sp. TaxID=2027920 RepID=UPI00356785A5